MKKARSQVHIVTPCLLAGADQTTAELRPASIRGQLRWWFRLLNPGQADREKAIFGGVNNGPRASSVVVRIKTPLDSLEVVDKKSARDIAGTNYDYFLWPLGRKGSTPRGYIAPNQTFELSITHRHVQNGERLPSDVLKAFLIFGALGTRSRRAYGSIYPHRVTIDGKEWRPPANAEELVEAAKTLLASAGCVVLQVAHPVPTWKGALDKCMDFLKAFRCGSSKSGTPSKWGSNDHDAPFNRDPEVYRQAIGLPLTQRYSQPNRGTFESEVRGADRWASPLLLKVIPLGEELLPLAIFCNSMVLPDNQGITLRDRGKNVNKKLSLDLWNAMQDPSRHSAVGWTGAARLT